jgi:serine phosphatase RsbU (regulator of sigma subunit)
LIKLSNISKSRIRFLLLSLLVVLTFILFSKLLGIQNTSSNPNLVREQLVAKRELIELKQWDFKFQKCDFRVAPPACSYLSVASEPAELPDPAGLAAMISSRFADANVAVGDYRLGESENRWLAEQKNNIVSFVIPNSVQGAVKIHIGEKSYQAYGVGVHPHFQMSAREILNARAIRLEYDFSELPWFGPPELSPALVVPEQVNAYISLRERQFASSNLAMLIHVGFPLVVAAIALVLDHSLAMSLLSLVGASQALRSFLAFLVNMQLVNFQTIKSYLFAMNGLVAAVLILFALELCGLRKFKTLTQLFFLLLLTLVGLVLPGAAPDYIVKVDHVFDFASSASCFLVIAFGVFLALKKSMAGTKTSYSQQADFTAIEGSLTIAKLVVAGFGFGVYAWANAAELWTLQTSAFKNFLDWKQLTLFPALISACLIDIGSTSKRMFVFARQMVAKAMMQRELELGREVQQRMLPRRRAEESGFQWRSVYLPASALAGDWYDIRAIHFASGQHLLVACIADVTGHGVGAALSTGVISSQWGLWCQELAAGSFPATDADRQRVLCDAPRRINEALLALRKNENCTAIFCIFDSSSSLVTLASAGHPGGFISDGRTLAYVTACGDRLGVEAQNVSWTAETKILKENEYVMLFSDGIVPVGKTISSWAGQLLRELRKSESANFAHIIGRQVRENRREFRNSKSIEDDITVLAISQKREVIASDLLPPPARVS